MRRTRRIAWATWAATLLGTAIGASLLVANRTTAVPVSPIGYNGFWSFAALTFTGLAFASVGALVASRRPGNAIGWLFCGTGILSGAELLGSQYAIYGLLTEPGSVPRPELGAWVYEWTGFVAACVTATFVVMLFPDGKLLSRAWRPLPWLSSIGTALGASCLALWPGPLLLSGFVKNPLGIAGAEEAVSTLGVLGIGLVLSGIVLSMASLALRYRRSGLSERQQIKWIAYAAGVHAVAFAVFTMLLNTGPAFVVLVASGIPITTGIAILRHRLYDIDLLIRRTVTYAATSAAIGVTFVAGIIALQSLLRPLTAGSDVAVTASTLLSFALFQPIRGRIQDAVNRRFDRARYDAARTLDVLANRMRDEVDIDTLRADLLGAVERTMAPTHASLWLRRSSSAPVTSSGRRGDTTG
jgi:hypothetical protein